MLCSHVGATNACQQLHEILTNSVNHEVERTNAAAFTPRLQRLELALGLVRGTRVHGFHAKRRNGAADGMMHYPVHCLILWQIVGAPAFCRPTHEL